MKHAHALAQAAAIFFLLALPSASAWPLDGGWSGVPSSVDPATGTITRTVTANAAELRMTVRWHCGQPTLCIVTGGQVEISPLTYIMVPPPGAVTPSPYFVITSSSDCVARYGSTARVGGWITAGGAPVVVQCFTVTPPPRFGTRSELPPIRFRPVTLPANIRDLARNARPVPPVRQPPPGVTPTP